MSFRRLASHKNFPADYQRAKELRKALPLAEETLWYHLRLNAKNTGVRFRQQHPLHPYIADFVCLKSRLVIEIDGASHDGRIAYDERRDAYLKGLGYEVMRFTNDDVLSNCAGVIQMIIARAKALNSLHDVPLP